MRTLASMALLTLVAIGCDSDSPTAPSLDPDAPFVIEPIVQVAQSGYGAPTRQVIRSTGEWVEAWLRLHAGLQPVPARPVIDFDRAFVIVAAAGTRPDGCYSIEITQVRPSIEGQPVFDVVETQPGPDCGCAAVITRPAVAVDHVMIAGESDHFVPLAAVGAVRRI